MSRLGDLGEILEDVGDRSSPQNEWYHTYSCPSEDEIQGSFTYRDKDNVLTVAYTVSHEITDISNLNSISKYIDPFGKNKNKVQARLCKKENKDMLEAMVSSESSRNLYLDHMKKDETYQKHKLFPYIAVLSKLRDAVGNEEDEQFKPYKIEVQRGIQKIIDKLLGGSYGSNKIDIDYGSASPATIRENALIKKDYELIKKDRQYLMNNNILGIDTSGSMPSPKPKKGLVSIIKNAAAGAALALGALMGHGSSAIIKEEEPINCTIEKEDTPSGKGDDDDE